MAAPSRSLTLAVSEAAPRCQDALVVGAETNYGLLSHVQGMAYARTVPLIVSLALTLNCNIRCLHCYNLDRDLPQASCHDRAGNALDRVGERGVPPREPVAGGAGPSQGPALNRPD